jgi:hypothetical protein
VEEHLDLSVFEPRYRNDDTGRSAYDPKVLLKIVLYGCSKGMVSSRKLEEACRRNGRDGARRPGMNSESLMEQPGVGGPAADRPGRRNQPGAVAMMAAFANSHRVFLQAR